jgi:hypothetical protein
MKGKKKSNRNMMEEEWKNWLKETIGRRSPSPLPLEKHRPKNAEEWLCRMKGVVVITPRDLWFLICQIDGDG